MKIRNRILTLTTLFLFSILCFSGCGTGAAKNQPASKADTENVTNNAGQTTKDDTAALASGGVIYLKVNPEIHINYDKNGLVTALNSKNDAGAKILESYTDYEGKECRTVINELVTLIGDSGYFVEEAEGNDRQITLEIEKGSKLPSETFIDDIIAEVKTNINTHNWAVPMDVYNESDYGMTEFVDTDYGETNDGVTDYNDGKTDYNDTDYGPNNDGVTDYDDKNGTTDYDDKSTNYGDSAYDK